MTQQCLLWVDTQEKYKCINTRIHTEEYLHFYQYVNKTLLNPHIYCVKTLSYWWTLGKLNDSQNICILLPLNYFLLGSNFSSFNFTTIFTPPSLSGVTSLGVRSWFFPQLSVYSNRSKFLLFQFEVFLWPRIWSISMNVPCAPEKYVFCCYKRIFKRTLFIIAKN